uniref:Uncharacterized protein n=2 Tax=Haptolina brevifila TaxID=156173 RepID=A0A7S2GYY5_9EUKA|mmetsp:Transcript_49224/g.98129  ORF Transcript_49224/g.98129 Transcript_49224/m.98129 type:complete len:135 (+) Transcript_49224:203-607(+)
MHRKLGRNSKLNLLREFSFLQNHRRPSALHKAIVLPRPPAELNVSSIFSLRSLPRSQPLTFEAMPDDLYTLLPVSERRDVEKALKWWTAYWCCGKRDNPKVRGSVWYDMFWDQPGHVDRFGRQWKGDWNVTQGP